MHSSLRAALFLAFATPVAGVQASSIAGNSLAEDGYDKLPAEIKKAKSA